MKNKPVVKVQSNKVATYAGRIARQARNGDIIGFAAVALNKDGHTRVTWFIPEDVHIDQLVGHAYSLTSQLTWYSAQQARDMSFSVPKRKKKVIK